MKKPERSVPCTCAIGTGYLVEITWPASRSGPTPCCSCSVERYKALHGEPTFVVTPVLPAK